MAHEFEKGFFVGQPAWHQLGVTVKECKTAEEAFRLAFNFHIGERPIYSYKGATGTLPVPNGITDVPLSSLAQVEGFKELYRTDTGKTLSVVPETFKSFQPWDQAQWCQPLLDTGKFTLETGLTLREGKRLVIVMKVKDSLRQIIAGDETELYLAFAQGTDGTMRIFLLFTPVRIVCMNTLNLALENFTAQIAIRHYGKIEDRLNLAQDAILKAAEVADRATEAFQVIAKKQITDRELETYTRKVFALPDPNEEKSRPRVIDLVKTCYESGPGMEIPGVRGSYWGAYNAVTDFVDHVRGRGPDTRTEASMFGAGRLIKEKALQVALAA